MSSNSSAKLSLSTTQETGSTYSEAFSEGFLAQNATKIVNGTWLGENMVVKIKQKQRSAMGNEIANVLGDVDFFCRTTEEYRVVDFFPTGATCDRNKTIPKDCDLYIEVASMTGKNALELLSSGKNKVERKKKFYENIFCKEQHPNLEYDQSVLALDYEPKLVLFVYNGRDFVDTSKSFCSDIFDSAVIHLPNKFCIRWLPEFELKEMRDLLKTKGLNIDDADTEEDSA